MNTNGSNNDVTNPSITFTANKQVQTYRFINGNNYYECDV